MDVKHIARGIADGISSIPHGMYLGIVRTWEGSGLAGGAEKYRNQEETERFVRLVRSLGSNEEPLRRLITIVLTEFYKKLSDEGREAVDNKLAYGGGRITGRTGGQFAAAYVAGNMILRKSTSALAYRQFVRFGASVTLNVVMLQGLIEEAGRASRRLRSKYPVTYYKVQGQNLDMVYFLVENYLEPYIKYINSDPQMCKRIDNEFCKIATGETR